MTKKFFLYAIAALGALQSAAAQPRLIVQIVVGSMRGEDLDRYAENFGEGGFRRSRLCAGWGHRTGAF